MSGPSSQQIQLQGEQIDFYKQGMAEAKTNYGEFQDLVNQMEEVYNPILAKGPNQKGFSAPEEAELNAQAEEGTAANYTRAARSVNEEIASEGGGDSSLPSGSSEAMQEEVAAAAAGSESEEENQVLQADYAAGLSEFEQAGNALSTVAGQLNPATYETAATGAGSAAEQTANQINQEENSWEAPVFGAIGSAAGAACPAKGALYLMADGSEKPVEELKVGELITGIDGETETIKEIQTCVLPVIQVRFWEGHTTRVSLTHAFALPKGGFMEAEQSMGRRALAAHGPSTVIAIAPAGKALVFNVITDGSHTYRADGIWALGVGDHDRENKDEWCA